LPKPTSEEQEIDNDAKFNFSYVECLLMSFHSIAKFSQDFLSAEENKDRLKEFRLRLQYFAKGTQNYIKELRNLLSKSSASTQNEEVKILY
jgi:hypothetical protein